MPDGQMTHDEALIAGAVLDQFATLLNRTADFSRKQAEGAKGPGQELYWEGYVDGLNDAAAIARHAVEG